MSVVDGGCAVFAGNVADGVATLMPVIDGLDDAGFPYWSGFARIYIALAHLALGDAATAESECRMAADLGERIRNPLLAVQARTYLAWCSLARDDVDGLNASTALVERDAQIDDGWLAASALAIVTALRARAVVEHDPEDADALIAAAYSLLGDSPHLLARTLIGVVGASIALVIGDPGRAEQRAADALWLTVDSGLTLLAPDALDVLAGTATAVPGRAGDAAAARSARLANAAAAERRRTGAGTLGLGLLSFAGVTSPEASADEPLSLAEVAAWLRRGRTTRRRPSTGWDSLTPAERSVVGLVVEGLTNAEAAARLFMSPRTVSTHLSHVFAKVGVTSRTELATLAARIRDTASS